MVIVKSKYIVCVKKSRSTNSQYITFNGESNQYNTRRELVIVKQIDILFKFKKINNTIQIQGFSDYHHPRNEANTGFRASISMSTMNYNDKDGAVKSVMQKEA